ncbi:hypothetical protein Tco_0217682 [Tanacetum coccineum]
MPNSITEAEYVQLQGAVDMFFGFKTNYLIMKEVTLAQALAALKSVKPKVKEPSVPVSAVIATTKVTAATTTTATIPTPRKGIVITELGNHFPTRTIFTSNHYRNKFRTKGKEKMDDIQAKIEADHELAQRLQVEEPDLVDGNSKRAGTELDKGHKKGKRLDNVYETTKVDDDQEADKIKELMEIVPDEEEVAIDAIPLATKSLSIGRFGNSVEIDYRVLDWKLYDSCGVHSLRMQHVHIHMLVEKRYPLTPSTITDMLNKKLQCDHFSEMLSMKKLEILKKNIKFRRIVRISLFNAASIIVALIDVNAAQSKLVLLENFNENYSKCLRLLYKVNATKGVNAASEEVSTAKLVSTTYVIYYLGKFDEKAYDGSLLGYSLVSKAFRVFNTRRQQTEETYHITFDESPDAIKFLKPSVENINIAKNKRYLPDEYLHPYKTSQRYC